jgi:hypothetical protein
VRGIVIVVSASVWRSVIGSHLRSWHGEPVVIETVGRQTARVVLSAAGDFVGPSHRTPGPRVTTLCGRALATSVYWPDYNNDFVGFLKYAAGERRYFYYILCQTNWYNVENIQKNLN